MLNIKSALCFVLAIGISHSVFVDDIEKCSIHDSKCLTKLYQSIVRSTNKNGMPEYGIPPTDPLVLKNVSIDVMNLININFEDGFAKNIKSCVFRDIRVDLDKKNFTADVVCDMLIKGKYNVTSSPVVESLIGGVVHGEGKCKVDVDKVHINAGFEIFLRKMNDDIYFDYKHEGMKFHYTFKKVFINFDSLYIGDQDLAKPVSTFINDNWRFITNTFGKPFVMKGMDIFFNLTHKFFDKVPAKNFIIEDLSPYL